MSTIRVSTTASPSPRPGRSSQGLKYKATVGLEVDKQQITIAARPTDLINGAPFLIALRDGAFDGATVQRDRVFLSRRRRGRRRRDAVSRPGLDGRSGRPDASDGHGRERSRRARLRHAAQPLFADLPAHALRCGLRRDPRNLCGERNGRGGVDVEAIDHFGRRRGAAMRKARSSSRRAPTPMCARRSRASPSASRFNLMYPLPFAPTLGRRLHGLRRLRPHAGDLPGAVQQSRQLPRLPVRAAAADGVLETVDARRVLIGRVGAAILGVALTARRWSRSHAPTFDERRERAAVVACGALLDRHALPSRGRRQGRRRRLRDAPRARLRDLGLVEPFDPRPYTRDWMLHRGEERYLGFLLARAHRGRRAGPRRRDPVSDRALLRAMAAS